MSFPARIKRNTRNVKQNKTRERKKLEEDDKNRVHTQTDVVGPDLMETMSRRRKKINRN